jgi:hydrogenase-4 component F
VTLLGIVAIYASTSQGDGSLAVLDWESLGGLTSAVDRDIVVAGFVLVLTGLAAKIGWAPIHNWLPDAHSEAPPPVSALLSAALLPAVALVGWRVAVALTPTIGATVVAAVFIGFGLASLAVAVPFLWRPLPWKRLLAYSSLEHMGVVALGIGFQHPLATAGVLVHVAGHAAAKATGFCAAIPLLRYQPAAGRRPPRGLAATSPSLASAVGLSLGALAGLPPSPLLVSEVMILLGGFSAGYGWAAAVATALLALGFLGLAHVLIESLAGRRSGRRPSSPASLRTTTLITTLGAAALAGLLAVSFLIVDSSIVRVLA